MSKQNAAILQTLEKKTIHPNHERDLRSFFSFCVKKTFSRALKTQNNYFLEP